MMKNILISLFTLLFFASPGWCILIEDTTSTNNGDDVGSVDSFLTFSSTLANSGQATETAWVTTFLNNLNGTAATYVIKDEGPDLDGDGEGDGVPYFYTDTADTYAFSLATPTDYFIVKNTSAWALFENTADLDWGVFDVNTIVDSRNHVVDMNIPSSETTISHITMLNGPAPVPEPSTVLLMGVGLAGIVGYSRKRSRK